MKKQNKAINQKKEFNFLSPEEFAAKMEQYSIDEFTNPKDEPYIVLWEAAQKKMGYFSQYSEILIKIIKKKTKDKNILNHVYERISTGRVMLYNADSANNISLYIDKVKADTKKADKVSVLPLLCGSGKSTTLTYRVMNTIIRIEGAQCRAKDIKDGNITEEFLEFVKEVEGEDTNTEYFTTVDECEFDGLVIVTDTKERLRKIWEPDEKNLYIDNQTRKFVETHQGNWVSVLTEENYVEEEKKQYFAPILCVTTQRYFSWKKEEILRHLEWKDDNGIHKRTLIIFDEQPYLNEVKDITVKTINDIDTALRTSLDDKVDIEEKKWCCEQWNLFRDWFIALLSHYEYDYIGADGRKLNTLYFEQKERTITEDDDKFFGIIEKHRTKIRSKDNDTYNDIYTVLHFMNSWSIFSHRDIDSGEYSNKFTVFIDNRDKVTNLGAKVVVLDGTGDISPIYSEQNYIDICDGGNYLRSLSYLTINICDFDTSKEAYYKNTIDVAKTALAYLKQEGYEKKDMVFFTYKGKESKFQTRVNGRLIKNVAHFGFIRGKNDFISDASISKNSFAQVGMNRMQPVHYLVHVLARHEDMREDLAKRDPESMYEQIQAIYGDDRYIDFMTAHVLTDTEQCIFRSAIRDADNTDKVIYYLFYKKGQYLRLQDAIEKRYKALGANVNYVKETDILDAAGAGTVASRLHQWLAEWDGKPIKQKHLLEELKINRNSFNTALRRDKELAYIFAIYKQNANSIGYRGAWYVRDAENNK